MSKEKIKEIFESKFMLLALVYAAVFLVSSFYGPLEILLIPLMIGAFASLNIEDGFYFFLYSQTFYRSELLMRPGIIAEVVYIVFLLIKFIKGVKNKKYKLYKRLGILIAIFTGYSLFVSLFHSMASYSIAYICYLPIFYIIFCTRNEYDLKKIVRVLGVSLVFSCVVSLGMLPITTRVTCYRIVDGALRFRGFYGSANTLYMTALLALSCYMYLYFKDKIKFKEYITMFVLLAVISLLTSSKANLVLLMFITAISIIFYLAKDFKKRIGLILIAGLLGVGVLLIFKDFTMSLITRFLNVDSKNFLNSLSTGRMDIWSAYAKEIFESPFDCLFGHGIFSSYAYVPEQGQGRAQHNLYIFLLYKFGVVGILFLFVIIWQFVKDCGKAKPSLVNFIPLLYFLVGAMVDNSFMYPQFYIIVAMVLFNTEKKQQVEIKEIETGNKIETENKV